MVDLNQIERNEIASQALTHSEWLMVRDRVKLLEMIVEAYLLDSFLNQETKIKKEKP